MNSIDALPKRSKRNLVAIKKEAYVWRVHSLGMGATLNHIPCWYVVDKDTDEVLAGGYKSGHNCQSGNADIPRRKDARAFIDGYNAEVDSSNPHKDVTRTIVMFGSYAMPNYERTIKGADSETESWWEYGNSYVEQKKLPKFSELR
ncbi:hypothetical protein [Photobacterium kishitanii]|uniref:Uncharacterized protein n=1 Tax=Photobacterium kishitanii TaxID=318456 RepID=A0A2T3KL10_9GAMM|nr:hypothetical protein [Photobacterium kishitanii]PSV00343.1 hypothetical protein C9J27_04245 [Photobacterium kishitanii]